jgi:hypothetical protein
MTSAIRILSRSITLTGVACSVVTLTGCGGGGSNSGGSNAYSGTWSYQTVKLLDACRLGISGTLNGTMRVEQSGSTVTVQAGSLQFTGNTNDKDGFTASVTRPSPNGCREASTMELRDASDGNGPIAIAIGAQCGNRACVVGYGGAATRTSTRGLSEKSADDAPRDTVEEITRVVELSDVGVDGGLESALEEALLEAEKAQ